MMKKWFKFIVIAVLALSIVNVYGRGRSGGRSSSSRSFGSSSRSTRSSSFGKSSKSSSGAKKSTTSWGSRSSKKTFSKPAPSKADMAKATSARKSRLASKSSSSTTSKLARNKRITTKTKHSVAVRQQKAERSSLAKMKADPKLASQYKSKFNKEPATRPDYIPRTYSNSGTSYNVMYNRNSGGYGYWGGGGPGLGTWMMYDALSDVAMYSMLSNRHPTYAYSETRLLEAEAEALVSAGRADEAAELLGLERERRSRAPFFVLGLIALFIVCCVIVNKMSSTI